MGTPHPLDWKSPDYAPIFRYRRNLLDRLREPEDWDRLIAYYRSAPSAEFVEDWVFTYEPRYVNQGKDPFVPFVLFPRQREYLDWLDERFSGREHGLVEKSRDAGVTWLSTAWSVRQWIFTPGIAIGFGSQSLDDVDTLGVPKSLLEKVRIIIRRLPRALQPIGWSEKDHARYMRIRNPETGAVITGDGGSDIGRGDRASIYFVDEAASLDQPEQVEAALSNTTDVRIDISTPKGTGNPFYRRKMSGAVKVFTFHWTSDPRKDLAWYEAKQRELTPEILAQEIDLDYEASAGDVAIPGKWVLSSQLLRKHLEANGELAKWLQQAEDVVFEAGLDVGGGQAPSVFVPRKGPVVYKSTDWMDGDTTNTAGRTCALAAQHRITKVKFDSVGVGRGVLSTLLRIAGDLRCIPINVGNRPSGKVWPDGKPASKKFINARAEAWWTARERLFRTHEHWLAVQGKGGRLYDLDELLLLPDDPKVCGQLSLPKYSFTETGKIAIERKTQMKARGVASPDHADGLVVTFAPKPAKARSGRAKGLS